MTQSTDTMTMSASSRDWTGSMLELSIHSYFPGATLIHETETSSRFTQGLSSMPPAEDRADLADALGALDEPDGASWSDIKAKHGL